MSRSAEERPQGVVRADICAIGAGAGGLAIARGAVKLGASTVLIERGRMGGDCLNYGCVPSKSLLAAGHAAAVARRAGRFGVHTGEPRIVADEVYGHVHRVQAAIAPADSAERFRGYGVEVIAGTARFVSPDALAVDGRTITARRFVIATGSVPIVPPIPGLADVAFLTNETLWETRPLPSHLLVLGGGPIGVEMAQAHRNLGCAVTMIEQARILPNDDPELAAVVRARLVADGITLLEGARATRFEKTGRGVAATVAGPAGEARIEGTDLLVAVGRRPVLDGLDLDRAGVAHSAQGVAVDDRLRTSNRRIYAVGDVVGGYQFAHMAGYHASIVLDNALVGIVRRVDYRDVPWVTFTDPELAHVGLSEEDARARFGRVAVHRWSFAGNDRALAEDATDGIVKVVTRASGEVVGAGIVGPLAGELIQVWILMIHRRLKLRDFADATLPYPTLGYVNKYAARAAQDALRNAWWKRRLARLRRIVG